MYIHKATKKALAENKCITIPAKNGQIWFKIQPTNTEYNCKLFFVDEIPAQGKICALSHGWQPNADYLMSNDWIVVDL